MEYIAEENRITVRNDDVRLTVTIGHDDITQCMVILTKSDDSNASIIGMVDKSMLLDFAKRIIRDIEGKV